jgi:hypothetical protein
VNDGVNTVCIPQRGGSKTPQPQAYEKSASFKQGRRFRAGIEGRISVLMRGRGMKRCRAEGAERFALFVGAAVLANNLMIVDPNPRISLGAIHGASATAVQGPKGATVWIAAQAPVPPITAASRMTATRVTRGAISLSNSSHLPPTPYSGSAKPVALPPGRARLMAKPAPTGSVAFTNTIGTARLARCSAIAAEAPVATRMSGANATNSSAYLR